MTLWLVRATWMGDEAESTENWQVNADSPQAAVAAVVARLPNQPHHVELKRAGNEEEAASDLAPGKAVRADPPR